jgi:alpha-ketoglutarate-dependent taurine dioxygenase
MRAKSRESWAVSYERIEVRPLAGALGAPRARAARPEFTCRFRWRENSVALWNNRATTHYAINGYIGSRRVMHRITIAGERLV